MRSGVAVTSIAEMFFQRHLIGHLECFAQSKDHFGRLILSNAGRITGVQRKLKLQASEMAKLLQDKDLWIYGLMSIVYVMTFGLRQTR